MRDDLDRFSLPYDRVDLDNGYQLALCMLADGSSGMWVQAPRDEDEQGCVDCATHEREGRLPPEWRRKVDRVTSRASDPAALRSASTPRRRAMPHAGRRRRAGVPIPPGRVTP